MHLPQIANFDSPEQKVGLDMSPAKKLILISISAISIAAAAYIAYAAHDTRQTINEFEVAVVTSASSENLSPPEQQALMNTPVPVQLYFSFTFPNGIETVPRWVQFEQSGSFRRPLTETFASTTARQVIATAEPDLVFSAVTPILGPLWAVAYDSYIDGGMEMEARLLSAVSVMHEHGTPTLNQISLRRWLIESPTNPYTLLPGGIVQWEAIDDRRARAIARAHGYKASLIATFDSSGALLSFEAEEDGDLTTQYHGSGEHVARNDYRLIDNIRIPLAFEISRMAEGKKYPFWKGRITHLAFDNNTLVEIGDQ